MKPLAVALAMMFLSLPVGAEEVTLAEYLRRVRENHPFFAEEQLKVSIEERDAESYLGGQEWVLSLSPAYTHLGEVSASELLADEVDSATVQVGLSRLFWSTGGTGGLGLSSGYANSRGTPYGDTDSYTQGVSLSYSQPLLKNRGGVLYRNAYEVAGYNAERVKAEIDESREQFLLDKAQRFLDWALASEQIRISERRLELAREQQSQVERRLAANLVDRVDLLRAQDAVRAAEQALIQLQSLWKAKQAALAVLAADEALYQASPLFDLYARVEPLDVERDEQALARDARALAPLKVVLRQLAAQRRGLEEELRSELLLSVGAGLKGSDEKVVDSLNLAYPDFTVALEYRVPSGHVTIDARIAATEARSAQIREQMRSLVVDLRASLRGLYIQIRDMEKILELGRQQIDSAQRRTDEELRLYNQGRGQLTFVIQSRDSEENARLAHAVNAAAYHSLVLQYRALTRAPLVAK